VAGKLVKEMEDDKVARGPHMSVRNRYTVYLCRQDYERWRRQEEQLVARLELHLTRYMRKRGYEAPGAISVTLAGDPELKPGHFGIYAEREMPSGVVRKGRSSSTRSVVGAGRAGVEPVAVAGVQATSAYREVGAEEAELSDVAAEVPLPNSSEGPSWIEPEAEPPSFPAASDAKSESGSTQVISADEVMEMGLVKQTIVLRANNQEHEFNKGRVIVGRSRDVDFRIDNPDVSRRHAAFYWSDGDIMVQDLGSTNGTMVNGYPVDSTVVGPGDVVVVGDCSITVESR
jgi:hypothetical protein